ncbi:protein transport protein Sec61 subunit beta-like [Olea europaea var. sylvestris]|uniref:protein transport protein Sec61 subunit beta-like n=1 Tax=Olea europaea var. sylvestris TaxID=158386 RepID=UPI000C1D183F|nr:protein transport protein Sec61 subunit beta-like [Olea europaea var. sylvestris]
MPRGSSQSQAASDPMSRLGPSIMAMPPRGSYAGMHCRKLGGGSSNSSSSGRASGSNMLRFYKDDAPGLKISPTVVLVRSFIGFVTALHAFGKFYRYKSGHGA